jgi:hypothetical protein
LDLIDQPRDDLGGVTNPKDQGYASHGKVSLRIAESFQ